MADRPRTIAEITAELVGKGLPKHDPNTADRDWHGPANCWMVHHLEAGPDTPRTVLNIDGTRAGHDWQFVIVSCCCCCDVAIRTELISTDDDYIGERSLWPGLERPSSCTATSPGSGPLSSSGSSRPD